MYSHNYTVEKPRDILDTLKGDTQGKSLLKLVYDIRDMPKKQNKMDSSYWYSLSEVQHYFTNIYKLVYPYNRIIVMSKSIKCINVGSVGEPDYS